MSEQQPAAVKLKGKQRAFVEEYLRCGFNATEAARRAKYGGDDATLRSIGSENLTKPNIRAEIERRMAETIMGANEVMARLAEQARANIGDFVTVQQVSHYEHLDPNDDESPEILVREQELNINYEEMKLRGHLVKRIGITKFGPVIELVDSQGALIQIGRHLGLFTDNQNVSGNMGVSFVWNPHKPQSTGNS